MTNRPKWPDRLLLSLIFWTLFLPLSWADSLPSPTVETSAHAHYQGLTPGPASELRTGITGGPAIEIESRSFQFVSGPVNPPYAWNDSDGRARASLPGTFGAYARAGGYSPNIGTKGAGTFATATARTISNWEVAGPSGETPIDVYALLDGILFVNGFGSIPTAVAAEVRLQMNLITATEVVSVFDASGRVDLSANESFRTLYFSLNNASSAVWNSAFNLVSANRSLYSVVDYTESLNNLFIVNNNERFAFEVVLTTTADNQQGPIEIFATSDFYDTGEVMLSVDSPNITLISHNPAPEPGSISLILVAAIVLEMMVRGKRY
jgi:hypothetical protein